MDRRERFDDPEEDLRMAMESSSASLWVALPAIVESVNFEQMTITATPALTGTRNNPDGSTIAINMPLLVDVPICFQGGGGYIMTLPIAKGDECLIVFADRCIDSWWQSGGVQAPIEKRVHDLSDGFAFVGVRSQPKKVANISTSKVQIRSDDGSVFVEIDKTGKVNITAPTSVTVTTPSTTITGTLHVNGAVTAGSTIVATGNVTGAGISLNSHLHGGVTTGPSNTGVPV